MPTLAAVAADLLANPRPVLCLDTSRRRLSKEASAGWPLDCELTRVGTFWDAVNLLEDDLTDGHTFLQTDLQWADVPGDGGMALT